MSKKILQHIIVFGVLCLIAMPLICYNINNNCEFWKVPVTSIVSALFVVYVSFYLVQWRNDDRERVRHVEILIDEIRNLINSSDLYMSKSLEQRKMALVYQRKVANKISVLETYKFRGEVKTQITKLKNEYKKLREFVGEHLDDEDYINKSESEIERLKSKLDNILDNIIVNLHK